MSTQKTRRWKDRFLCKTCSLLGFDTAIGTLRYRGGKIQADKEKMGSSEILNCLDQNTSLLEVLCFSTDFCWCYLNFRTILFREKEEIIPGRWYMFCY